MSTEKKSDRYQAALKAGVVIFGFLALLTAGEYLIAVIASPWVFILWIVAIAKAYLVIKNYMHIGRLFNDEETH